MQGGYLGVAPETCDPNTEFFDPATQTCIKFDAADATAPGIAVAVPFYKKPLFWVAIVGVIATGGGALAFARYRRRKA